MDALEFLRERERMCDSYKDCDDCPLAGDKCIIGSVSDEDRKEIVTAIEQWSKEHPRKTRQSVFLEQYPNAWTCADGVLSICPKVVADWHRSTFGTYIDGSKTCVDCRRKFWMQEVE